MNRFVKVAWFLLATAVLPAATLASVSVSLAPGSIHVPLSGQTQFTAVVSGTTNNVVIWGLTGTACSGIACGQITSGGFGPSLGAPIAMGYVSADHAADGSPLALVVRDVPRPAHIAPLPFVPTRYYRG